MCPRRRWIKAMACSPFLGLNGPTFLSKRTQVPYAMQMMELAQAPCLSRRSGPVFCVRESDCLREKEFHVGRRYTNVPWLERATSICFSQPVYMVSNSHYTAIIIIIINNRFKSLSRYHPHLSWISWDWEKSKCLKPCERVHNFLQHEQYKGEIDGVDVELSGGGGYICSNYYLCWIEWRSCIVYI